MNQNNMRPAPPFMIAQIGDLYHKMRKECDKIFREQGFPLEMDQIPVLMRIYYSGGMSQQAICSGLDRDKASVNRTISFLLKKDIVAVLQDPTDKRKTHVELTVTGKKLATQASSVLEKFDAALSSGITREELMQFNVLMSKLIDIVTPM